MGWLRDVGFSTDLKPFGEFTHTHKFIYLASNIEGAKNAAFKATAAARGRLTDGRLKVNDFTYNGTVYAPQESVYTVVVSEKARVFDFATELLNKEDTQLLCRALCLGRKSLISYYVSLVKLLASPRDWVSILDEAISVKGNRSLDRRVEVLSSAGADLIKNIERDGDGQNYGVVYALPLDKLHHATII